MRNSGNLGVFSSAMTIVGSVIGAGFASGQEIWSFFGIYGWGSLLFVLPLFLIMFTFIILSFSTNCKSTSELGKVCFGKFAFVLEWIFTFCCFCLLSSMIAGMRTLCSNFPLLFLVCFCIVGTLLYLGILGIAKINTLLLPIMIVLLIVVCAFCIATTKFEKPTLNISSLKNVSFLCPVYGCLNILCALPVVLPIGAKCNNKKRVAFLACGVVCVLFFIVLLTLLIHYNVKSELPIFEIAKKTSPVFGTIYIIILLVATATTLLSSGLEVVDFSNKYIKNRAFCVGFSLFSASILSILGFEKIVKIIYPIMGFVGIFLFFVLLSTRIRSKKKLHQIVEN